ncbi:MAG TPA: HPr family phosphocarrier protein [Alphaproteobacteria bacterium]|nr:HPr family phosphocarrier protein [Alphaproteobacteria bacterium]
MSGDGAEAGAPPLLRRTLTILNQRGLHARAAARFVKCAEQFDAEITVAKKESTVSGLSIMGLMMLAAGPGTTIEVTASGSDAAQALAALEALVAEKFGEE